MSRRLLFVGLIVTTSLIGGCSSKGNESSVATAANATAHPSATPSLSDAEKSRQFAQCLRDHGVNVQDSQDGKIQITERPGTDKNKMQAAMEACQSLAPAGKLGGKSSTADLAKLRQFTGCMRDHGVKMPDPDPNGGLLRLPDLKNDAKTKAAMGACQHFMPGVNGGPGAPVAPGTTGGSGE